MPYASLAMSPHGSECARSWDMALSQPLIASALCSCYPPVVAASSEQLELYRFVLTASRTESLTLVSSISEANKALLKDDYLLLVTTISGE